MSRWSPETLTLRLGDAPVAGSRAGDAGADAVANAFERAVQARALPTRARVNCVLGGEWVRYAIVPWHEELSQPVERLALARQQFIETHGEAARAWQVCLAPARYGRASLAAAIDATVLDRLAAAAHARGLRLQRVQPALVAAYNAARGRIDADRFWFVLVEPSWTTLWLLDDQEPSHVKRLPAGATALPVLLEREWFALGIEAPRCSVYTVYTAPRGSEAHRPPAMRIAVSSAWNIVDLTPVATADDAWSLAA